MTVKNYLLTTYWILIGTLSMGQPHMLEKTQQPTMANFQIGFNSWATNKTLSETKGWKWYKRWEEQFAQRSVLGQPPPSPELFFEAIKNVAIQKQNTSTHKTQSSWSPVGPDVFPSPGSSYYGMGRVNCIAFHPSDPNIFWVGVAQGGMWKTTDGGSSWITLTDDLPIIRVSDIAVHPTNPDIMYISLGDYAYLGVGLDLDERKRNTHYGIGVYKTIDGGATWQPSGLTFQQTDGAGSLMRRVLIHKNNPDTLVAAGISGIWKSYDAGTTWTHIMDSIIWDFEYDPIAPNVLYASGGYIGSYDVGHAGVFKSTDFGSTWTLLNTGIPATQAAQRIELAIAPSNTNYIYALACDMIGGLYAFYQSTDGGTTWVANTSVSPNILEWYDGGGPDGQGTYDLSLMVNPFDENRVYAGGINMWTSGDGGVSWEGCSSWYTYNGTSLHADQHQFKHNPLDGKYYVCNDAGVYRTDTIFPGSWQQFFNDNNYIWPTTWEFITQNLQITSFYRVGICNAQPTYLLSGAQDNGTFRKAGNTWAQISGGDGMDCTYHPYDTNKLYVSSQYGNLRYSSDAGNNFSNISPSGEEGEWTTPIQIDPNDPDYLFAGFGNVMKKYANSSSWSTLSNFPNIPAMGYPSLSSALAISPINSDVIYVTKRIHHVYNEPSKAYVTSNGGGTWTDISTGLPDSLYPTSISIDDFDPETAWITYSGFVDGVKVFKTNNGGSSWDNISNNLPNIPVNTIVNQPNSQEQIVYVGTDLGVYFTSDTSTQWHLYSQGLPNVIVSDLELDTLNGEIVASTFGRGVWKVSMLNGTVCNEPPEPSNLTGPAAVCVDSAGLIFSADTVQGAVYYSWTIPNGWAITAGDSTNEVTLNPSSSSGQVCVAAANSCGVSSFNCFDVTIWPLPDPIISYSNGILSCSSGASYQWYYNDTLIGGANAQDYQPLESGNYTVLVNDANGCTALSPSFNITLSTIYDIAVSQPLVIYPNPFDQSTKVFFPNEEKRPFVINIYDLLGKKARTMGPIRSGEALIVKGNLQPGNYLIEVQGDREVYQGRIFIK